MNTFQTIILISLIGNILIGFIVLGLNPHRQLNRYFFLSTCFITMWLLCMLAVSMQLFGLLLFWTRQVSTAALFLPLGFYMLRLAIMEPNLPPLRFWYRLRYPLLAAIAVSFMCQTSFFVRSTTLGGFDGSIPVSDYGPGIYFFILYFVLMVFGMAASVPEVLQRAKGGQRVEAEFLLLGWFLSFVFGVAVFAAPVLLDRQEFTQFLPLVIIILDGFVAYGIATRRILSVSEVLQRVVAYILVAILLTAEYFLLLFVGQALFRPILEDSTTIVRLLAVLTVAFSVVPIENGMHLLSRHILVHDLTSSKGLLARAGGLIREILLEAELVPNFMRLVCDEFGAPEACLLRGDTNGNMIQTYPEQKHDEEGALIPGEHGLLRLLRAERGALTVTTLNRMRPKEDIVEALHYLKSHGWDLAVGGFIRGELKVLVLLQSRNNFQIYDIRDQRAIQILCDQFAVALENSYLYTEVQNARIYNEILLNALKSGIVAVDMAGRITMMNRVAERITGLSYKDIVGEEHKVLPADLSRAVLQLLSGSSGLPDRDILLDAGQGRIPIRLSGSAFHGHTGEQLGVLLVFTDMTELKAMEEQVRRSDRLSVIGTLSAGMAHEIKNPLVTINTFTQLLPEQYADKAFRETFFELVGKEARRIDTLVNRLLRFARPVQGDLREVSLHACVQDALRLVRQQLDRNRIELEEDLQAQSDCILADREQLNQAFVNFLLNAIDAMPEGGQLYVSSANVEVTLDAPFNGHSQCRPCVEVTIRDTGIGIQPDDLSRIFDPFFTRKDRGIGLGLSVTHGIIQEHHAAVLVDSTPGEGTTFTLQFPLHERSDVACEVAQ